MIDLIEGNDGNFVATRGETGLALVYEDDDGWNVVDFDDPNGWRVVVRSLQQARDAIASRFGGTFVRVIRDTARFAVITNTGL